MRRASSIWLLFAASAVVGCNTPTAPSDAAGDEIVPPARAVAVQYRPVYLAHAAVTVK